MMMQGRQFTSEQHHNSSATTTESFVGRSAQGQGGGRSEDKMTEAESREQSRVETSFVSGVAPSNGATTLSLSPGDVRCSVVERV